MTIQIFQVLFYLVRLFHPKIKVSARLPLAQALLESAAFTSPVYRATNNMFGMMKPQVRSTTAIGKDGSGYAVYRSPLDSIRDYFLYLEALELFTDDQLDARLSSGKYATDPKYYKKVLAKAGEVQQKLISPDSLILPVVAVLVVGFVFISVAKKVLA